MFPGKKKWFIIKAENYHKYNKQTLSIRYAFKMILVSVFLKYLLHTIYHTHSVILGSHNLWVEITGAFSHHQQWIKVILSKVPSCQFKHFQQCSAGENLELCPPYKSKWADRQRHEYSYLLWVIIDIKLVCMRTCTFVSTS